MAEEKLLLKIKKEIIILVAVPRLKDISGPNSAKYNEVTQDVTEAYQVQPLWVQLDHNYNA